MAKAFISYSHQDERALERLHAHFATLRREGILSVWYDREILAGGSIDREIASHLSQADLFLALVSPDFLASSYCYDQEMAKALERHAEGTLRVVPIIVEPCDWKTTPLGKLKALPNDGRAISTWTNENIAYLDVVTELRRLTSEQQPKRNNEADKKSVTSSTREGKRYRIKKEFDPIDRDDFRHKAFLAIQEFFRGSVEELNQVSEFIRARHEKISDLAFSCTALNKANGGEAHITLRADSDFGEDISYSFSRRATANTANGFVRVEANEYELYLMLDNFSGGRNRDDKPLTGDQVADALWREFTSQAGIDHE